VAIFLFIDKRLKSMGALKKEEVKPHLGKHHVFYVLGGWFLSGLILFMAGIEIYRNRYFWSEGKIWFVGVSAACIGIPILVGTIRLMFEIVEESVDQATRRLNGPPEESGKKQVDNMGQDQEKRNPQKQG